MAFFIISQRKFTCRKIGTTSKGIGPTYSTKCFRNGIRVGELLGDFEAFSAKYVLFFKKREITTCIFRF